MKREVNIDIKELPDFQQQWVFARLQAWRNANVPEEKMIYKAGYDQQIMFIRDQVIHLFGDNVVLIDVVSTHTSKSILLPVYYIKLKDGTEMYLRENFGDWKVSINASIQVNFPLRIFSCFPDRDIHTVFCEGFDDSWVYPHYEPNSVKFTIEMHDNYYLFVFFFLLREQLYPQIESL